MAFKEVNHNENKNHKVKKRKFVIEDIIWKKENKVEPVIGKF